MTSPTSLTLTRRIAARPAVVWQALTTPEGLSAWIEVDPPTRLVMTWRWEGDEDEGTSRIEITLRPVGGGTELTFTHSGLADEATRDGHARGWSGSLDKLERHLAGEAAIQRGGTP